MMQYWDLWFRLLVPWCIILATPTVVRVLRRKPWSKISAVGLSLALVFINSMVVILIFRIMTTTSPPHSAITSLGFGIFLSYFILRWETNGSAERSMREKRKKLGYDD